MRTIVYKLFEKLEHNKINKISFYHQGKRIEKSFAEFASNISEYLSRINYLKTRKEIKTVAIIGPTSYDWAVCEYACIKGGFLIVAVPETFPEEKIKSIIQDTHTDILLVDFSLKDKISLNDIDIFYIECHSEHCEKNFIKLPISEYAPIKENLILEEYSIVFSSGTTDKIKYIKKTFKPIDLPKKNSLIEQSKRFFHYHLYYKRSFWAKNNNKLILFMPFSHPQQRDFFRMALFNNINIVLSDPQNCLKHIILEKPNIMISVPLIYEVMANGIKVKIEKFNSYEKFLFRMFNNLRINRLSNKSYLKKIFSSKLFPEVKKIYGGRADYFVTGSAPISPDVIKIFYSIGVKLFQAYGQSESSNIAMNTPENFKIGSVGKPLLEVKISEDSEILVKYNSKEYEANKDILNIDSEEFIHTGDLGYIDKDGFLFITGRKDDVIVLENGEKVFPEKIESLIKASEIIKDACIFIKEGYKLYAVLNCIEKPEEGAIRELILSVNYDLPTYEKISAFHISEEAFSKENGLLTATYKKKRKSFEKHFSDKKFIPV
jgi:long-chain acyl-CoA synthetase